MTSERVLAVFIAAVLGLACFALWGAYHDNVLAEERRDRCYERSCAHGTAVMSDFGCGCFERPLPAVAK